MLKWYFRLLPVCVFVWVVRKLKPQVWYVSPDYALYMPYKDIFVEVDDG